MPRQYLLLHRPADNTGTAIELEGAPAAGGVKPRAFTTLGPGKRFRISFEVEREGDAYRHLQRSANVGGGLAYELLYKEGYIRVEASARFRLKADTLGTFDVGRTTGHSGDLLFALAVVMAARPKVPDYPVVAATGVLNDDGWVQAVEGVPAKIEAVLALDKEDYFPPGSIVFVPHTNMAEIGEDLRLTAWNRGVKICPVSRLVEAVGRLITIREVYLDCPYRGLEEFEYEHRSIYFGRDREIAELTQILLAREKAGYPGVLILAPSGAGKSSLVRAGLIWDLKKNKEIQQTRPVFWQVWKPSAAHQSSKAIPVAFVVPDKVKPIDEVTLVRSIRENWKPILEKVIGPEACRKLAGAETLLALSDSFAGVIPRDRRFLWMVNQMEELFTLSFGPDVLQGFSEFLRRLQGLEVWVVATLRNDFYSDYKAQAALCEMFEPHDGQYDLRPLDSAALEQIIRKPAELAGLANRMFAPDPDAPGWSLAASIQDDMTRQTGGLPLLEFYLTELYMLCKEQNLRGYEAYRQLGKLEDVIGSKAQKIFEQLNLGKEEGETALRQVLWALSTCGAGHREQVVSSQSALIAKFPKDSPPRKLIDTFVENRLLVKDKDGDSVRASVRVAHEALLDRWPSAKSVIDGILPTMRLRRQLMDDAELWQASAYDPSRLLPEGLPLEEGQNLLASAGDVLDLDTNLVRYIEASIQAKQRRDEAENARIREDQEKELAHEKEKTERERKHVSRFKKLALGLLALTVIAGIASFFALRGYNEVQTALSYSDFKEGWRLAQQDKYRESLAYLARSIQRTGNIDSVDLFASLILSGKLSAPSVLIQESTAVESCRFSPDGNRILTASAGGTARVWDAKTGQPISKEMRHLESVSSVQFSSDGLQVLTASYDGTARLWESETGQPMSKIMKHEQGLHSAKFSPDGRSIVTSSIDTTAKVWDARTGEPYSFIIDENGSVTYAEFSPDNRSILTSAKDGVDLWDAQSGRLIVEGKEANAFDYSGRFSPDGTKIVVISRPRPPQAPPGALNAAGLPKLMPIPYGVTVSIWEARSNHFLPLALQDQEILSAEFSPDGSRLVTASYEGLAQVWEVASGQPISKPMRHRSRVNTAKFSPDGRLIVTASDDKTVLIWDAETGDPLTAPMQHQAEVSYAEFSPDGGRLVSGSKDGLVLIWDISANHPSLFQIRNNGSLSLQAKFDANINRAAVPTKDQLMVQIFDVRTGQWTSEAIQHEARIISIEFSPDGERVITASVDGTVGIWNAETSTLLGLISLDERVSSAAFSPDGHQIVTAQESGAQIWNAETLRPLTAPIRHEAGVYSAEFIQNGRSLLTIAKRDKTIKTWDTRSGQLITEPVRFQGKIQGAKIDSTGRWVALAVDDQTIVVWDSKHSNRFSQEIRFQAKLRKAHFSPDGARIVTISADNSVRIWDTKSGQPRSEPMMHEGEINFVDFSPDGRRIVTASEDNMARIYDVKSGQLLCPPMQHFGPVNSARFSPNGHHILTASDDFTVRLWSVKSCQTVSQPMRHPSGVRSARFSSDGHWILTEAYELSTVWENPSISEVVKNLSSAVEAISGYHLDETGELRSRKIRTKQDIEDLLRNEKGIYSRTHHLLEWWLTDPIKRTLTPNSKQNVKDHVDQLINGGTASSLGEALDYWPGHAMALAKLASATLRESPPERRESMIPRIRLWANLARQYSPKDPEIRTLVEQVLRECSFRRGTMK